MADEMESIFYYREVPWHGLGVKVETALESAAALKLAGLDWEVTRRPVQVDGNVIEDYFANVRVSDNRFARVTAGTPELDRAVRILAG